MLVEPKGKSVVASTSKKNVDDTVALAMKHIFSQLEINELDIADGLKELLYEKKYDLNSILQTEPASVSRELGIEEYIAKIIIDAAKRKATE